LLFSVRFVAHCNVRLGLEQEIYSELLGEMLVTAELAPPIPAAEALADELLTTPDGTVELPLLLLLVLLLPADDEVVALLVKVRKAFIHLVFIDPAESKSCQLCQKLSNLFEEEFDRIAFLPRVVNATTGRLSITTCSARFLVISGHTLWHAPMSHKANGSFVHAHSKAR
jgi:hypothetical protein